MSDYSQLYRTKTNRLAGVIRYAYKRSSVRLPNEDQARKHEDSLVVSTLSEVSTKLGFIKSEDEKGEKHFDTTVLTKQSYHLCSRFIDSLIEGIYKMTDLSNPNQIEMMMAANDYSVAAFNKALSSQQVPPKTTPIPDKFPEVNINAATQASMPKSRRRSKNSTSLKAFGPLRYSLIRSAHINKKGEYIWAILDACGGGETCYSLTAWYFPKEELPIAASLSTLLYIHEPDTIERDRLVYNKATHKKELKKVEVIYNGGLRDWVYASHKNTLGIPSVELMAKCKEIVSSIKSSKNYRRAFSNHLDKNKYTITRASRKRKGKYEYIDISKLHGDNVEFVYTLDKFVGVPKAPEPKAPEPKAPEPKAPEPKAPEPKAPEPKAQEPKAQEPKAQEPKAQEPKASAVGNGNKDKIKKYLALCIKGELDMSEANCLIDKLSIT